MSKQPREEPRRVESPARMVVAEDVSVAQGAVMRVADMSAISAATASVATDENGAITNITVHSPYDYVEPPAHAIIPRPWHDIAEAPRDGTLLEGRAEDGSEFHMIWRRTSRHNGLRWVPVGFWSSHLSREPLKVVPMAYRLPEGFMMPGAVVA
jgi:hypothetical protein